MHHESSVVVLYSTSGNTRRTQCARLSSVGERWVAEFIDAADRETFGPPPFLRIWPSDLVSLGDAGPRQPRWYLHKWPVDLPD